MAIWKTLMLSVLLLGICNAGKYERTVKYKDEILIRCPISVEGVKEFLQSDDVDVWRVTADGMADVRINKDFLQKSNRVIKTECVAIANVEDLVQQFEINSIIRNETQVADDLWFEDYHGYEEIYEWYKDLATEHSDVCKFIPSIGESLEGRDQPAVHIGIETGTEKLKIYFQCQIHAREWISGATCMYMANYLVTSTEERVKNILEKVEFIFVPFVNPDGYEYTRSNDRLWRKNRRQNSGSSCLGVDLNRNYNEHWSEGGSSSNPCSETYHGTGPASEPETQNTQNYFRANSPIIGAIDWHSYSQLIMRPYGWTNEDSPDDAEMKAVGDAVSAAIFEIHGKTYTSQKKIGLYPTSGTASDWCYGEDASSTNGGYRAAGYSFELRDTGQYGFLLPPDQIIPTGEENIAGALVFAEMLFDNPLKYEK